MDIHLVKWHLNAFILKANENLPENLVNDGMPVIIMHDPDNQFEVLGRRSIFCKADSSRRFFQDKWGFICNFKKDFLHLFRRCTICNTNRYLYSYRSIRYCIINYLLIDHFRVGNCDNGIIKCIYLCIPGLYFVDIPIDTTLSTISSSVLAEISSLYSLIFRIASDAAILVTKIVRMRSLYL